MGRAEDFLKILVIGESTVGKSSLILRYTRDDLTDGYLPIIGIDVGIKRIMVGKRQVKLHIWDTAGQERFRSITKAYYRGAHGILVVFDVARRETFTQTGSWMDQIRESCDPANPIDVVLVGNIREGERVVTRSEGAALAARFQVPYFETNVLERKTVDDAFYCLAEMALTRWRDLDDELDSPSSKGVTIADGETNHREDCPC
jgi:small GTP-binding protein